MFNGLFAVNAVLSNGGAILFYNVDENKQLKEYSLPIERLTGSSGFECENLSWDGRVFKLNGVQINTVNELLRTLSKNSFRWLLVDRLTDNNGNCIGVGILSSGKYLRIKESEAIDHIGSAANAFVRDGAIVNKCKETPKVNIVDTIKKPEAPAKPEVPVNKGVLSGEGMQQKPVTVAVNKPVSAPTVPTAPAVPIAPQDKKVENPIHDFKQNKSNDELEHMKELVDILNEARRIYEQGEDEIMSNKEYDALYDELEALEKKTGVIMAGSPTQEVGYEVVSGLEKCAHDEPMLSLGKTKSVKDLQDFLVGMKEGILSWKLDGLTVVATYKGGVLQKAVTRGNGYTGELVTNNAKTFVNMPKQIGRLDEIVLRGEAVISYADFEKIKATPEGADYKNPRNLCSGSVRQLDSSITARRNVRFVVFQWVNAPAGMTKEAELEFIAGLGFEVVQHLKTSHNTVDAAVQAFAKFIDKNPYPSDGLVLTFNDVDYGKSLGVTAKTPKHSIAFKWQDEEAETELIKIDWTVGRSGVITPTAVFKPVDLEGSTVARASLHNLSIMEQVLGKPYVGQKIWVYKANMIIPQISRAVKYNAATANQLAPTKIIKSTEDKPKHISHLEELGIDIKNEAVYELLKSYYSSAFYCLPEDHDEHERYGLRALDGSTEHFDFADEAAKWFRQNIEQYVPATIVEQVKKISTLAKEDHLLKLTDDPRVTRMGNLNQWTVQFEGDEIVFDSYEKAVAFADKNGL